jgi:hypothetical protein
MSSMYNHGHLVSESGEVIDSVSSNPHVVEIMSFPISDDGRVCVVKLMVGSSLEQNLELSTQTSLCSDRIIGNLRIVSTILTGQERFKLFGDSIMVARGTGYFSGSYGFLCRNDQSFERENITIDEFDELRWDAFGICPNKCVWYGQTP